MNLFNASNNIITKTCVGSMYGLLNMGTLPLPWSEQAWFPRSVVSNIVNFTLGKKNLKSSCSKLNGPKLNTHCYHGWAHQLLWNGCGHGNCGGEKQWEKSGRLTGNLIFFLSHSLSFIRVRGKRDSLFSPIRCSWWGEKNSCMWTRVGEQNAYY